MTLMPRNALYVRAQEFIFQLFVPCSWLDLATRTLEERSSQSVIDSYDLVGCSLTSVVEPAPSYDVHSLAGDVRTLTRDLNGLQMRFNNHEKFAAETLV